MRYKAKRRAGRKLFLPVVEKAGAEYYVECRRYSPWPGWRKLALSTYAYDGVGCFTKWGAHRWAKLYYKNLRASLIEKAKKEADKGEETPWKEWKQR